MIAFSLISSSFIDGIGVNAYAASKLKKPSKVKVTQNDKDAKITVSWKKLPKKTKVQVYLKKGNGKYKRIVTTSKRSFIKADGYKTLSFEVDSEGNIVS